VFSMQCAQEAGVPERFQERDCGRSRFASCECHGANDTFRPEIEKVQFDPVIDGLADEIRRSTGGPKRPSGGAPPPPPPPGAGTASSSAPPPPPPGTPSGPSRWTDKMGGALERALDFPDEVKLATVPMQAQEGRTPAPGFGLDCLSAKERAEIEHQVAEANRDFSGGPPRRRHQGRQQRRVLLRAPRCPRDGQGGQVCKATIRRTGRWDKRHRSRLHHATTQMKHRKYDTSAETEAAAKKHFGDSAKVVKNIITLPLATAKLREAIAGRILINKIEAVENLVGKKAVRRGGEEEPGWFTLNHP
jgi:hypothetical protein